MPTVTFTNVVAGVKPPVGCTNQSMLVFVRYSGDFYSFVFDPTATTSINPMAPSNLISASSGSLAFSGGTMSAGNVTK